MGFNQAGGYLKSFPLTFAPSFSHLFFSSGPKQTPMTPVFAVMHAWSVSILEWNTCWCNLVPFCSIIVVLLEKSTSNPKISFCLKLTIQPCWPLCQNSPRWPSHPLQQIISFKNDYCKLCDCVKEEVYHELESSPQPFIRSWWFWENSGVQKPNWE